MRQICYICKESSWHTTYIIDDPIETENWKPFICPKCFKENPDYYKK